MTTDAIRIEGLSKSFKPNWPGQPSVQALDGLSMAVREGEIFGFLGPNGSGKTTTIKILLGLMRASSGTATLLGQPAGDVASRRHIGFLPEAPYFYDYLTAEEFLTFYGRLAGLSGADLSARIDALLAEVGLSEARTRQLRKFSKGMLQRIGLAQALIHDPRLVILDEPMSGLDPIGRKQVRDLILSLRDRGKTVFFSSHIIPDVEVLCDRVAIVIKGRLMATGRIEELVSPSHVEAVEIVCERLDAEAVPTIRSAARRIVRQGQQCLIILPSHDGLDEILASIRAAGGRVMSVTPQKASLEDLFMAQAAAAGTASARRAS